ncbi:glycoside hydrolase family protein [Coraliomargarita algicola]|uniref:Glycoside hydrolase family protein n=1 Tax=Coraliomargarita algicola TaxID=3092156 RepID=A0ABZ0RMB2_9BACT|nr:glycoside hydrolase family protein [Coraliomargarita sp. J2-16]WPJ96130.1 glycoside hydrolase family protein [Coraliomargarita sp. J2-16]
MKIQCYLETIVLLFAFMSNMHSNPEPFHHRLTPKGRILDLNHEGYIVWTCSPIRDDAGKVHVFFNRVPEPAFWFKNFRTQGHIMHAVANQPEGPYTVKNLVIKGRGQGHWDGYGIVNPRIYRVGEQYALFFTSYEVAWPLNDMKEHIGLLLSDDLKTWRRANGGKPILSPSDEDPDAFDHQIINNASFVQDPETGEFRLYYRGIQSIPKNRDYIGYATATSLEGPWVKSPNNPVVGPDMVPNSVKSFRGFEDPCVWIENGLYHMLTKDMGYFNPPTSAYFQSSDGIHWGVPVRGYDKQDDSPQLLFDAHGAPDYLFVNRHKYGALSGYVYKID